MIQIQALDGLMLREMVLAGTALLEKNREKVDALNVFPVPDGDTGTNMSLTMASAVRELNAREFETASQAANALAKGALRGARGNSGVITSQLFRGFAKALDGVEKITPVQFAEALKNGADTAYKAVMRPKEGTILTVARVIAEDAMKQAQAAPDDFDALFRVILSSGESILSRTTDMLPALKQAGVVDAGGKGLLLIYTGYAAVLRGETIEDIEEKPDEGASADVFEDHHEDDGQELKFAYHVGYTLKYISPKVTGTEVDNFRRQLNRIGENVYLGSDMAALFVHVHTNDPGKALQYGQMLGELVDLDIQNLAEIRRLNQPAKEPPKPFGMVAVSLGEGFSKIFKDLGVDVIVEGGQTMNPSIDDLARAIEQTNAESVFVFPNNGNVVLAAQQAAQICEKAVHVIPTKNVAMGIAAIVAFRPDMSAQDNATKMEEASQQVRTGTITYAVRDSEFENLHIKLGDIIGLHNGAVTCKSEDSVHDVACELMREIVTEDDGLITLYYGQDTAEEDAQALAEELEEQYPDCDVEVQFGGQPLYYYLIAVE